MTSPIFGTRHGTAPVPLSILDFAMAGIPTGSQQDGTAFTDEADMTCGNWTSNGEGSAMVGRHDPIGNPEGVDFWNFSHGSRGCSQEALVDTGGAGLFYCFATDRAALATSAILERHPT